VTVACAGTPSAFLVVSQDGHRDGGRTELNFECGPAVEAVVDLEPWRATVSIFPSTPNPGVGAVAGFRLERRPPP
jgi:hypothetical protein